MAAIPSPNTCIECGQNLIYPHRYGCKYGKEMSECKNCGDFGYIYGGRFWFDITECPACKPKK